MSWRLESSEGDRKSARVQSDEGYLIDFRDLLFAPMNLDWISPPPAPMCCLFSGFDRGVWRREEQPPVSLHQEWVHSRQSHDDRRGVQHEDRSAGQLHHQSSDLGHSRPGALQSHHLSVGTHTHTHTIIHAHNKESRSITASTSHFTIIIMSVLSLLVDSGITGERLEHCWSMTLASTWPMRAQSGGWRSCTTTQTLTSWSCWWETRATWSPSGPCPQGRPETLQVRAVML